MHLRDELVLEWLKEHQHERIPHDTIAEAVGCHRHTARAIVKRLESAGRIEINRSGYRGGWFYKCKEK
jgi:DNA-binding IclR family transcriptional regulator